MGHFWAIFHGFQKKILRKWGGGVLGGGHEGVATGSPRGTAGRGGGTAGGVQRLIDWGFFEDATISEKFCAPSKTTQKRKMRFLIGKSTISKGFLVFHGFG